MTLARTHFPGYPAYLEVASRRIGHPESAGPAARIATLAAIANLCAQAIHAVEDRKLTILAKAEEFRNQLRAAQLAADLMLEAIWGDAATPRMPDPTSTGQPAEPTRQRSSASARGPVAMGHERKSRGRSKQ